MIIEISVPASHCTYAVEIYLFFLFFPTRKSIVTLQTVKIAGRRRDGILEYWNAGWGMGHQVRGRRSEVRGQKAQYQYFVC